MSNFAEALQVHLESDTKMTRRGEWVHLNEGKRLRILAILRSRPSKRRTRRINAMEHHAIGSIGLPVGGPIIDWISDIDWAKWGPIILKVLLAIISIIMML
jgi:hypothetical protein